MKVSILLIALICCQVIKAEQSLVLTEYPGVCTKELQGTLEERVRRADVVLTGTIRRLETESHETGENVEIDGDPKLMKTADERSSTRTVAIVELWQVVKGSLVEVANQSAATQDEPEEVVHGMMQNPFLKLYGLWNAQLCGSSLSNGDTRIFFLKKFRDVREISSDVITHASESELADSSALPVVLRTKETDETELGELKEQKPPKKGKKKKNKKDRKKKRGGKKKKGKKTKKGSKPRKPKSSKGKRKKRKSESMRGKLTRLSKRHKRSSMIPNKIEKTYKKRDLDSEKPRSVLVLNASPARITLTNLNMVDELAKLT